MARLVRVNIMRRRRVAAVIGFYLKLLSMYLSLVLRLYDILVQLMMESEPVYEPALIDYDREQSRLKFIADATSKTHSLNCIRVNPRFFRALCNLLVNVGGLTTSNNVGVDEMVVMFLFTIGHNAKNRILQLVFRRSGETIHRHLHKVLHAILKCNHNLLKQAQPIPENSNDSTWKHFKNCLGALDGTHIKLRVRTEDQTRYRDPMVTSKKRKNDGGRGYFPWNLTLENHLIDCMTELAANNGVVDGIFKGGAYKELERMMEVRANGCGVKAYPHIKSKMKLLKQNFQAYQQCRGQSGWGWDDVAKCPLVDAQVFDNFAKNHPNCNGLNGKPFPQYENLLKVFGRSRATGKGAVAANEDVSPPSEAGFNDVDTDSLNAEGMAHLLNNVINETVDMPTPPTANTAQPANSASDAGATSGDGRSRRPTARRIQLENSVSDLTAEITQIRPAIEKAVDSMVNNLIGNDEESNNKRLRIMTDLQNLPGLTRHQVIDAASALYRDENHRDLEFFYMLDTMEDKLYFILAMLRK
ncbi:hypothetical protein LINPERHAP1_LOCUS7928 [Linum perenne]